MFYDNKILVGKSNDKNIYIYPSMANRHGLIAGATGTGKTITLKVLAESFSDLGVPVFLADAKGDLSGMCQEGVMDDNLQGRITKLGLNELNFGFKSYPTTFWDIYQEKGISLRTTISEMGPLLLSRIMELSDVQQDVLTVIFKIADDENLLLTDIKDLQSMIKYISEHSKEYSVSYGNMSKQSLSAIMRSLVALESNGGNIFFGEPALDIKDWIETNNGKGKINILDCQKLMLSPKMYATFMLWMLSELFETLPEAGDLDKPRMIFFFDEAHMLFDSANKALLEKIEQVVKLIRSKGVGIYFITQNPKDIPDGVLAQLGNKIQHALHAYTPNEQKAAKAAAQSFRENETFNTYEELLSLGIGEALISVLDEEGIPTIVEKCKILPPQSLMGTIDDITRSKVIQNDLLYIKYYESVDNESAYEFLMRKTDEELRESEMKKIQAEEAKQQEKYEKELEKQKQKQIKVKQRELSKVASSAAGTIGRELGNTFGKTIGGTFGKRLGGNVGASLGRGLFNTLFKK